MSYKTTDYNSLYLGAALLSKLAYKKFKKKCLNYERLIESSFLVLCTNHNTIEYSTSNLLSFNKDIDDLTDKVKYIYLTAIKTDNIFNPYFNKVERNKIGFIPFYSYDTRQKYCKELINKSINSLKKALILEFLSPDQFGYSFYDDSFYLYYIDWTDFKLLDYMDSYIDDYFYNIYDNYQLAYDDLFNIQFYDIELFLKEYDNKPPLTDKLDYLEGIGSDYIDIYRDSLDISRDCLEVHNIKFYY